mmetsp:Transcript_18641/g.27948  ORF Transcript_18641/g.27948 Transcript_18641/m.27948 type:complete len:593 (-) Transcript_18641:548-2326(-)
MRSWSCNSPTSTFNRLVVLILFVVYSTYISSVHLRSLGSVLHYSNYDDIETIRERDGVKEEIQNNEDDEDVESTFLNSNDNFVNQTRNEIINVDDEEDKENIEKKDIGENENTVDIATIEVEMSSNNSTLQSDIIQIVHNPNEKSITISYKNLLSTMNANNETTTARQCLNPIIRGRLSGPALSIIQWTPYYANTTNKKELGPVVDKMFGRYSVPLPGKYYIEIIGIMCNHRFHIPNDDFRNQCLIHPSHHRLTADGAYIDVGAHDDVGNNIDVDLDEADIVPMPGHWKWNPAKEQNDYNDKGQEQRSPLSLSQEPLYTRYQPPFCRGDENKTLPHCADKMDLTRYEAYEFEFDPELKSMIETSLASSSLSPITRRSQPLSSSTATDRGNTTETVMANTTVCLVGFSHSRHMRDSMRQVVYYQNPAIQIDWGKARFPDELHNIEYFNNMHKKLEGDNNCTHVLIGLGQWAASKPLLFDRYERDIEEAMRVAVRARDEIGFALFFRSIHYNPMGDVYSSCPPHDWRYPPVIDGYNAIIKSLCEQYNIPFLDTNAMFGPMWDSGNDWCHPNMQVGLPEAFYLLGKMMMSNTSNM